MHEAWDHQHDRHRDQQRRGRELRDCSPATAGPCPSEQWKQREAGRDLHEHCGGDAPAGTREVTSPRAEHRDQQAEADECVVVPAVHDRARDHRLQAEERERAGAPGLAPHDPQGESDRDCRGKLKGEAVQQRMRSGDHGDGGGVEHEERTVRRGAAAPPGPDEREQRVVPERARRVEVRARVVRNQDPAEDRVRPEVV